MTTNNVPHIGVLSSRGINEEPRSTDVTVSSNFEGDQLLLRGLEMQVFPKRPKPGAGPASLSFGVLYRARDTFNTD